VPFWETGLRWDFVTVLIEDLGDSSKWKSMVRDLEEEHEI
jgi:hypothetical protein